MSEVSRRRLLGLVGGGAALAGAGVAAGVAAGRADSASGEDGGDGGSGGDGVVAFHGEHQAGIVTPAQDRMHVVALDVTTSDRDELIALLKAWTDAARRMTAGAEAAPGGATGGSPYAPPEDTGEALGLAAASLTLTVGFGASLFDDRFGLAGRKPAALAELPHFPADALDPARTGGDIVVQACADDPQVAVHAVRNLIRMGFGTVAVRWSQLGFGRTSSTTRDQATPRNLFGFKDGTNNVTAEEDDELRRHVWVPAEDEPAWMTGGTYMVTRRIRMHIEIWDREPLEGQEAIVGRAKGTGAPLGGAEEFDQADFDAVGDDGQPVIATEAHIRLASAAGNGGARMLRRGYNFVDGSDGVGHLDAGLFFICFVRDPHTQFVPVQQALSSKDVMMEYLEHTGSGLFAVPPGVAEGGYWGETLFG
jgi:deferrochelatase/peroxidase EfeB